MHTSRPTPDDARVNDRAPGRKPLLGRATSLFDYAEADDCFSDAGLAATKLNADEQLTRFLHWLQFTDRGHLPC